MIYPQSEREARKILDTIGSVLVDTTRGLDFYTCGDAFRKSLLQTKREIYDIYDQPKFLERLVLAGFGCGKSHFMECVHRFLRQDLSTKEYNHEIVVSRVDITKLESPDDLEYRIVEGMEFPDGRGYGAVLAEAYGTITGSKENRSFFTGERSHKTAYAQLLLGLMGYAIVGDFTTASVGALLNNRNIVESVVGLSQGLFKKKKPSEISLKDASPQDRDFIEAYLKIIANPNQSVSAFRQPAKILSKESKLTDLVFRILKLAKVKMVVILIDELESLNRKGEDFMRNTLERIRAFRDDFNKIFNSEESYPATALVMTSTDLFFQEEVRRQSTALYSRWIKTPIVKLGPMSDSDIDNLIYDLRKLYFFAGEQLPSLSFNQNNHDVAAMRNRVKSKLDKSGYTTRNLVVELKSEIEACWHDEYV